jgi:hypothetical protein
MPKPRSPIMQIPRTGKVFIAFAIDTMNVPSHQAIAQISLALISGLESKRHS